ncbi:hypothetical protein TcBrA4_0094300 [Trypanosoma cruzi]|nr:hypothetical protein TcBrA4_0094300 [Trypanosoma cruzi]
MTDDNAEESFSEAERVQGIERHAVQLESENIALREEMAQRAVAHREAMEGLNNKISKLMEELEAKGMEYTETLGKLEEFVGLLEAARAAEKSALMALEKREQELFELQAAHDEEMRELESAMKGLDGGALPPQGGAADFPAAEMQANTAVADVDKDAVRRCGQQLERLKRRKEALLMELEVKGRQHEDALIVLNRTLANSWVNLTRHTWMSGVGDKREGVTTRDCPAALLPRRKMRRSTTRAIKNGAAMTSCRCTLAPLQYER